MIWGRKKKKKTETQEAAHCDRYSNSFYLTLSFSIFLRSSIDFVVLFFLCDKRTDILHENVYLANSINVW